MDAAKSPLRILPERNELCESAGFRPGGAVNQKELIVELDSRTTSEDARSAAVDEPKAISCGRYLRDGKGHIIHWIHDANPVANADLFNLDWLSHL